MNFVILKIHFQLTDPRHLKISSCIFKSENLTEQNSLICQDLHVDCRVILIYSRWETLGWPSPEFISRCRPASRIYMLPRNAEPPGTLVHIVSTTSLQLESTRGGCAGIIMDVDRINYIFTDLIYFWTLTDLWDWKTIKVLYANKKLSANTNEWILIELCSLSDWECHMLLEGSIISHDQTF